MNRYYRWIKAIDPSTGRPYLIYGGVTDDEARQKGLESLPGIDFDIMTFPTRDIRKASAMLRGKRLDETHSLRSASERIGHERSLRQRKQQDRRFRYR